MKKLIPFAVVALSISYFISLVAAVIAAFAVGFVYAISGAMLVHDPFAFGAIVFMYICLTPLALILTEE